MSDRLDWKAVVGAGIIAGVVFLVLEMMLVATVGGGSPWGPPRMIAAIVMGPEVLPPPATFDAGIMIVAMMIHFALSIVFASILGLAISRWRPEFATVLLVGTLFGLLIYFVNFYIMTEIWPWFAMARNFISLFAHAMFGLVLGWAYHAIAIKKVHRVEAG